MGNSIRDSRIAKGWNLVSFDTEVVRRYTSLIYGAGFIPVVLRQIVDGDGAPVAGTRYVFRKCSSFFKPRRSRISFRVNSPAITDMMRFMGVTSVVRVYRSRCITH